MREEISGPSPLFFAIWEDSPRGSFLHVHDTNEHRHTLAAIYKTENLQYTVYNAQNAELIATVENLTHAKTLAIRDILCNQRNILLALQSLSRTSPRRRKRKRRP